MKFDQNFRPLGELVKFSSGGTPKKTDSSFWNGTIPWISAKTMKSEHITTSDLFITQSGLDAGSKLAPKGSILLLTRGSGLFKDVPICMVDNPVAFNQDVKCIESTCDIENKYIFYWLLSIKSFLLEKVDVTGIGAGKFNMDFLKDLSVPIFSKDSRNRIIDSMDAFSDKIELNQKINENLEQQAQVLFNLWFGIADEKKATNYKQVFLDDLMDYAGGSQPPASRFIDEPKEGYIRFVQIRDYESDSHLTYIPISHKNKICDERDIMLARYGAALGRVCFGLNGAYNVALAKVFPKKSCYREFLRCYLSSQEFYLSINNKGGRSAQAGFNKGDIHSFELRIPDDSDSSMEKFEEIASKLFEKRLLLMKENKKLATLRDTLLPKLMSGEIDVEGIEL